MTKLRCASIVIPVLLTACAPEPVDIRISVEGARVIVSTTSALLASVADLAVDTAGRLYALDPRNFHVVVLDANHEHHLTLSREGAGPGEMRFPVAASVDGDTLYVADMGNARVDRWTLDGQHVGVVRSDGFGGTGPFSLSGKGWLATGTLGTDSALVELYNAAGQASGKTRPTGSAAASGDGFPCTASRDRRRPHSGGISQFCFDDMGCRTAGLAGAAGRRAYRTL